ncbi:golgin candidate 2-like isoform X2 [Hevea brasiliensis]|uniref:golgin candidate 2-like isoform X2 n=1 Tax=Hevea brasiliensis TaxID=3981 RepID=UPI0025ED7C6E|nr:golgin candidate 2-like isoform X2 [Hevea brasiliensis]
MANWISSKLKVAETFFEQIDQQAAESLKKNEDPSRYEDKKFHVPSRTAGGGGGGAGGTVSLKDQLKKKTAHETNNGNSHKYFGKSSTDPNVKNLSDFSNVSSKSNGGGKEIANAPKSSPKPRPTLTDSDWTELLSTPTQATPSSSSNCRNEVSAIRGLRKYGGRKQGSSGSTLTVLESGGVKSKKRFDISFGTRLNVKPSDEEESTSSARSSSVDLQSDGKILDRGELDHKDIGANQQRNQGNEKNGKLFESKDMSEDNLLPVGIKSHSLEMPSVSERVGGVSDVKKGMSNVYDRLRSTVRGKHRSGAASRSSASDDLKKGFSTSDEGSDSDSDSVSTSDSENEQEREMREKILAEKAAAKAVEAIKERENMVARLEGEKQSLEKILEERAKQQAEEASELQTTMMETMEAVELEKQKHNNTRMEALARLAKLETANADLARSLATAQKNLEMEINRVAELRQQLEFKELAPEELRRKVFKTHQTGTYLNHAAASKGLEFERDVLEAEYSFLNDKIGRLEDKAKKLEANIEMTRKDLEEPTEVEIEVKRRLAQLTDHLIQKQAQAVSRLLDENRSISKDMESGTWEIPNSKSRPLLEDKIRLGSAHLGSLLQQLDAIFAASAVFVRRNPTAKLWSLVYLVCLHFWVIYILLTHSQASNEGRSGAIISLENINNTADV